jgi:redox-sensitive bicupin YhaK (pirin superfamily)
MREFVRTLEVQRGHWVGDGFPVRSLLSPAEGEAVSPFLLLDRAGPHEFAPAGTPRGVGAHPHKGFETVTIVYSGEVAHCCSTGAGGVIGPGDVQWMTAAAGIVHEEFHSEAFTAKGGTLEMV